MTADSTSGDRRRRTTLAGAAVFALLLAGCAARVPPPPPAEGAPPGFPAADYEAALAGRSEVYRVDAGATLLKAMAGRDGALARMGHDHVIAGRDVAGYVRLDPAPAGAARRLTADLYAPLERMTVDEPELRVAAGFDPDVPEGAREGTRSNMLLSLEAADFPWAVLHVAADLPPGTGPAVDETLRATLTLHGVTRDIDVRVQGVIDAHALDVESDFTILQSDFGIEPYSVLGGALRVRDELAISIHLRAGRL